MFDKTHLIQTQSRNLLGALMVLVLVLVVFTSLWLLFWEPLIFKCVVSLFGLVPDTDACFTRMVLPPAAIIPGVASGTVSVAFSISELSVRSTVWLLALAQFLHQLELCKNNRTVFRHTFQHPSSCSSDWQRGFLDQFQEAAGTSF